ncbi:MAG: hypothetical protein JWQ90_4787 [Hydrocarboniphaga sp.]|nr:hypothetical protein [Hydrocarboniphaga sp.]
MSITPLFWFRKGHPLESHKEISLADICSYPIISFHAQNVSREVNRLIWQAIKDAGLPPPKILIDTSHLLVTLDILTMSDATMLGLEHLSQVPAFRDNLVSRPMEYVESVGRAESTLTLIQHERTAQSSVHLWISEMIRGVFRELSAEAA